MKALLLQMGDSVSAVCGCQVNQLTKTKEKNQ
jgi:hypothetical protein